MSEADTARSYGARLRLRELAQYYSTTSALPATDFGPHIDADGIIRPFDLNSFQATIPELSTDPSLTALAQLTAVRLNCQRAFVSLIAESAQHVVAEATGTVSPFDKDDFEGDDNIILGAQSIPLPFGICTTTIGVFTGTCGNGFGPDTEIRNDYICIPDLLAENQTSSLPAIKALPPILRFYLEVPLTTESGYVIGSLCVMDPTVRKARPRDVKVMRDMSKLVMRHLELTRKREDHLRAERLLAGLGSFIRGDSSILNNLEEESNSSKELGEHLQQVHTPPKKPLPINQVKFAAPSNTIAPAITSDARVDDLSTDSDTLPSRRASRDHRIANTLPENIRHIFSRAALLIRESMGLDASYFLEVLQDEQYATLKARQYSTGDSALSSLGLSELSEVTSRDLPANSPGSNATVPDVSCHQLGYSTRGRSSLVDSAADGPSLEVPCSLINQLSIRYPQGRLFHFDSMETTKSTSDEQTHQGSRASTRRARRKLSTELARIFLSATSLMFLPIYHNSKQQAYAAYLGWTTNTARGLQESELTYVSGFVNSMMCEIMRVEAQATDRAKSDFISSISHELRSPLHGILASTQLLSESDMSLKQGEFLEMIDTCARALLDIMEHLLDHAKINHFTKQQDLGLVRYDSNKERLNTFSLVSELDLMSIVEETVASMSLSTGESQDRRSWQAGKTITAPSESVAITENSDDVVQLILNITRESRWLFISEAGSWRRIVLNLVGNSLKYTRRGHVVVHLTLHGSPETDDKRICKLSISDTGQGISPEYLKHRLYTPFAQEDNLSVGTGLGLSLVRKIVRSLGGDIEISSEVGVGTQVVVSVPLEQATQTSDDTDRSTEFLVEEFLEGHKYKFLGFKGADMWDDSPIEVPCMRADTLNLMKTSLASTLTNWFKAEIVDAEAEILVIEESFLKQKLEQYDIVGNSMLIVGYNRRTSITNIIKHAKFVHISPPTGPKRIAQALKTLLKESSRTTDLDKPSPQMRSKMTAGPSLLADIGRMTIEPSSLPASKTGPEQQAELNNASLSSDRSVPASFSDANIPSSLDSAHLSRAILLVDDNEINLRLLTAAVARLDLKAQGITTLTATNGLEALNTYITTINNGSRVCIVLMDISMPVMDGITATKEIRAFETIKGMGREIRSTIIAVTGLASAAAQKEIVDSGFDLYLRKPVGPKKLREEISSNIGKVTSD